jgi:prevent-host-death family protein
MVVTNVATLKASLSDFLAGVKAGEEVIVTEHGRPVARIVPYEPGGAELDDLVRSGQVRRSRSHLPPDFWTGPRPDDVGGRLLQTLLEERETTR